ncbi:MAG: hypothetical protein D5R99_06860 [Methanocalculus sp. MSAO_Arc1]|uniref:hypothetical protein n=1 Tax=Methanocalculus TaxID=71151 RepID=UPI000FEF1B26|nr:MULTISPECIES: hypothetical protein [unclassified Methanocalculus]MCP1663047.1 hypothetical protein [Methanocalculus sp. AMF5]RQD79828.1 MAG: hypothetical protein D5R99_06860 [Methanocalculus sp. MSAO_Arc1]
MKTEPLHSYLQLALLFAICLVLIPQAVTAAEFFDHETMDQTYAMGMYTDIHAIEEARDGGYILGGYVYKDGIGSSLLIRTDKTGEVRWSETYPGDWIVSLKEAEDETIYFTALTWIQESKDPQKMKGSGYLASTDREGALLWKQELENHSPATITLTDNELLLVGWRWTSVDQPDISGFFSRYGWDGTLLGEEEYPGLLVHDILPDEGSYLLFGGSSAINEDDSVSYAHITSIDTTGEVLWSNTIDDLIIYSAAAMDEGYVMSGSTHHYWTSLGQAQAIGATDEGNLLWKSDLPGYAGYAIARYGDDFLVAGGTGPNHPFIASITADGDIADSVRLTDADGRFTSAETLSSASVAVAGWSRHTGEVEGWLRIFDPTEPGPGEPEPAETPGFGLIAAVIGCIAAAVMFGSRRRA